MGIYIGYSIVSVILYIILCCCESEKAKEFCFMAYGSAWWSATEIARYLLLGTNMKKDLIVFILFLLMFLLSLRGETKKVKHFNAVVHGCLIFATFKILVSIVLLESVPAFPAQSGWN